MKPDQLAAIKARAKADRAFRRERGAQIEGTVYDDVGALLAEIDRLRAVLATTATNLMVVHDCSTSAIDIQAGCWWCSERARIDAALRGEG